MVARIKSCGKPEMDSTLLMKSVVFLKYNWVSLDKELDVFVNQAADFLSCTVVPTDDRSTRDFPWYQAFVDFG